MNAPWSTNLANTGSDLAPWLIIAGVIVVLGVIALVIGQVIRSRRSAAAAAESADATNVATDGDAASVLLESDAAAETDAESSESTDSGESDGGSISPDESR